MKIIIIIIIKVKKIKMMLISLILLRTCSSNKFKILDKSFISKDLILTYLFTRPGSFKCFLHNSQQQQAIP